MEKSVKILLEINFESNKEKLELIREIEKSMNQLKINSHEKIKPKKIILLSGN